MFSVQNDLFGNLIWIFFFFFSPQQRHFLFFFSFTIWCNTEQRCLSNGFSKRRNLERPFFRLQGGENLGFGHLLLSTPLSRNSILKWRPIPEHWLHSVTLKWITINRTTDGFLWRSSCDLSSVCWVDSCINLHYSTLQSLVVSQELLIASLIWLSVTDMQDLHSYW